jgi:hypothetical protein
MRKGRTSVLSVLLCGPLSVLLSVLLVALLFVMSRTLGGHQAKFVPN